MAFVEYFKDYPALPNVQVFADLPREGYKMIKRDLDGAVIPYETEEGKCDFHALRHTYCTRLARAGVQPQIAMKLARHSTIDLTMKHYTHFSLQDKSEAMQKLPQINFGENIAVRTGTDNFSETATHNFMLNDTNSDKQVEQSANVVTGGENGYDQNLPKQADFAENRLDRAGQENSENFERSVSVSGCDIKKNTVKDSVLGDANSFDIDNTNWCRGGDLNPHTLMDKRF